MFDTTFDKNVANTCTQWSCHGKVAVLSMCVLELSRGPDAVTHGGMQQSLFLRAVDVKVSLASWLQTACDGVAMCQCCQTWFPIQYELQCNTPTCVRVGARCPGVLGVPIKRMAKKSRSPRTKPLSANTDVNRGNWAAIGKCIPQMFLHITRGHQGNQIHNCIARWIV